MSNYVHFRLHVISPRIRRFNIVFYHNIYYMQNVETPDYQ